MLAWTTCTQKLIAHSTAWTFPSSDVIEANSKAVALLECILSECVVSNILYTLNGVKTELLPNPGIEYCVASLDPGNFEETKESVIFTHWLQKLNVANGGYITKAKALVG